MFCRLFFSTSPLSLSKNCLFYPPLSFCSKTHLWKSKVHSEASSKRWSFRKKKKTSTKGLQEGHGQKFCQNLREPHHTPGAHPRHPRSPKWKELLHKLLVGVWGMFQGYVGKFWDKSIVYTMLCNYIPMTYIDYRKNINNNMYGMTIFIKNTPWWLVFTHNINVWDISVFSLLVYH